MMEKNILYIIMLFSLLTSVDLEAQSAESKWNMSLSSGLDLNLIPKNSGLGPITLSNNGSGLSNIGVGYVISPAWEVRGQVGWANFKWRTADDTIKATKGVVNAEVGILATCDAMFSPINALYGFNADRMFDLQLFAGVGGFMLPYNHTTVNPMAHVGVQGNFYLSNQFSLNVEMANYIIFDSSLPINKATHFIDNLVTFSIGFTYHFGIPSFSGSESERNCIGRGHVLGLD
jgi:hypothetical protein